jgi:hypothetical protein
MRARWSAARDARAGRRASPAPTRFMWGASTGVVHVGRRRRRYCEGLVGWRRKEHDGVVCLRSRKFDQEDRVECGLRYKQMQGCFCKMSLPTLF